MAELSIDKAEKQKVDDIVKFVSQFYDELTFEGRCIVIIELNRRFAPELDELRRRNAALKASQNPAPPST